MNKKITLRSLIVSVTVLILISLLIVSCSFSGNNKFINLLGTGGSGVTLTNGAVHIDTSNARDWYNSVLFDGNAYYISGWQKDSTMKYAIIKLKTDLTLDYARYYTASGASNIGLINLWFDPSNSNELFVGGWYNNTTGDGIIGKINKNTGSLTVSKLLDNIGSLTITTDNTNLYGVTDQGYILKMDLNLNLLNAMQISNYVFENIAINNDYIATYRYNNNPIGVVIMKKDLSSLIQVNINSDQSQIPLMDNDYLYLIDKSTSNKLLIAKIDISNLNSLNVISSKEYSWDNLDIFYSESFLSDGNIVIGITTNESPNNLIFLKINKNDLSIMNQIKLSAKGGGDSEIMLKNIFPTLDGGFFAARYINGGDVGYALKMPSDFSLGNNCVFNTSNPNIIVSIKNIII